MIDSRAEFLASRPSSASVRLVTAMLRAALLPAALLASALLASAPARAADQAGPGATGSSAPNLSPAVPLVREAEVEVERGTQGPEPRAGVVLGADAGMVRRSLGFSQDVYHRLRSIGANLYVLRLGAELYPALQFRPLEGHLGLVAAYEGGVAGSVRDQNFGGRYPISHSELSGGLRLRSALRGHELGFNLTLGRLRSGLEDHGAAGIPGVAYTEVRSGVDVGFQLRGLHARAGAGFRVPLAYGEISHSDWFPRVGGYGADASVDVSYALSERVALLTSASLRRFVLEMNSEPEDASAGIAEVAGGATDTYLGGYLGLLVTL